MEKHVLVHFNQLFHFFDFHDFSRISPGFSGVDTTKVLLKIPIKMVKTHQKSYFHDYFC